MFNRRLEDQALILEACATVRKELHEFAAKEPENWIETSKILLRLATLYSLLDLERIKEVVVEADKRSVHEERKAA